MPFDSAQGLEPAEKQRATLQCYASARSAG